MGDLELTPGPPVPDLTSTSGGVTTTLVASSFTGTTELDLAGGPAPTNLVADAGTLPGALQSGVVGVKGDKGDKGDPGPQNLFVQQGPAPAMPVPGLWIELNPDSSVKTFWVGTNP